jgi:hypothetical protein
MLRLAGDKISINDLHNYMVSYDKRGIFICSVNADGPLIVQFKFRDPSHYQMVRFFDGELEDYRGGQLYLTEEHRIVRRNISSDSMFPRAASSDLFLKALNISEGLGFTVLEPY